MSTTVLRRPETSDPLENERYRRLAEDLAPLLALPFAGGTWLRDVAVVAGTNTISHKLGRPVVGWLVTRIRGAYPQLFELPGSDDRVLLLSASAPATVDLWVFP